MAAHETRDSLPKMLPGVVCRQWVRCGRAGCRCATGRGHGPYHYRFWRQAGRLRKQYVRQADVVRVSAACEARRHEAAEIREAWAMIREMASLLKSTEAR